MNEEVLKAVLTEIMEEQKMLNTNNGLITKAVEDFFEKLSDFENKLSNIKKSTGADLQIINTNLQRLKIVIEAQPKQIVNEKRILFFPDTYKHEFYKIVFGAAVKSVSIVLITLFSFFFLKHLLIQQDNAKYKAAWEWLYQHQGNKGRVVMDRAIFSSIKSKKF